MSHRATYKDIRLLIVDDDRMIRATVLRAATAWEYAAEECESAEAALTKLQTERYNIILTDIRMGRMDGLAFAQTVTESMPSTAVIIMTGSPTTKTAKQSQDLGAIYYLQKPLDPEELGETLRIATAWNIGMLIDRAARRFLALRKGHERDTENRLKSIKTTIKRSLAMPGIAGHLRDFVYGKNVESNPLYVDLNREFSPNSMKGF